MMNLVKESNLKNGRTPILNQLAAFGGLLVLVIVFSIASESFFSVQNFITIGLQTSIIAILGIGMTFVVVSGGIDLGVGSVLALSGVVCGLLLRSGSSLFISLGAGIGIGILCGLVNGWVIARGKLPPFIATLGMMMVARGFTLHITQARPISDFPEGFEKIGERIFNYISVPTLIMFGMAVLSALIMRRTRLGRYVYAIGSNEEASRLSGVHVHRVKYAVYGISGACSAIAGIVLASRLTTAQPTAGQGYELDAIAAAVIGGASLMGGAGTIMGTLIGAFVIGVLRNGLNMLGVSAFLQQITIGVVIIFAVYLDQFRNQKK